MHDSGNPLRIAAQNARGDVARLDIWQWSPPDGPWTFRLLCLRRGVGSIVLLDFRPRNLGYDSLNADDMARKWAKDLTKLELQVFERDHYIRVDDGSYSESLIWDTRENRAFSILRYDEGCDYDCLAQMVLTGGVLDV